MADYGASGPIYLLQYAEPVFAVGYLPKKKNILIQVHDFACCNEV